MTGLNSRESCLRVAIATNIPTPYRSSLFAAIASQPGVRLRVFFCGTTEPGRHWEGRSDKDFDYELCPSLKLRRRRGVAYISPSLARRITSFKPDVVVAGGLLTGYVARSSARASRSRFYVWSEATYESDYSSRAPLSLAALRRLVASADGCIASSTDAAEYFAFLGAPLERIATALMGVDTDLFLDNPPMRESVRVSTRALLGLNGPTVLYVGRLEKHKGVDLLIAAHKIALGHLAHCELMLVGEGSMRPSIERRIGVGELQHVHLVGFKQPADLPPYFYASDVFCLLSRREPFGAVVPEAMAAGLPVVCSRHVGSARDLVREGANGYIVDPEEAEVCASRLVDILSHPGRTETMRAAAENAARAAAPETSALGILEAVGWTNPGSPAPPDKQRA